MSYVISLATNVLPIQCPVFIPCSSFSIWHPVTYLHTLQRKGVFPFLISYGGGIGCGRYGTTGVLAIPVTLLKMLASPYLGRILRL